MEKSKLKNEKLYEMCKSYKNGYKKSQKKVSELSLLNEKITQKFTQKIEEKDKEINKLNTIVVKYKQIGSDFATKKQVLYLQQTVNTQEEKMFKLKEKIKEQDSQISNFNEMTKTTKDENLDLKNTLNNIQIQISKHLIKSVEEEVEEYDSDLDSETLEHLFEY